MRDILDKLKTINEGHLGQMADMAERDHEVQMARADLYKLAKYAIKLHEMLKGVSEMQGIEGWQQAKITKAADYISSVYHNLDYEMSPVNPDNQEAAQMDDMAFDLASESKETVEAIDIGKTYRIRKQVGGRDTHVNVKVTNYKKGPGQKDIVYFKDADGKSGQMPAKVFKNRMKEEVELVESIEIDEAKADPKIVARFAKVPASQRSYYIMKWAEETGIDSDEAMELAGYERGGYMGAGAYRWNYVGESEDTIEEYSDADRKAMDNLVKKTVKAPVPMPPVPMTPKRPQAQDDDPGMMRDFTPNPANDPAFREIEGLSDKEIKSKFSDWSKK